MGNGTVDLWAWTTPAFSSGSPVDHTWVTTYDNRLKPYQKSADVAAAGEHYWYSYGTFHPTIGVPGFPGTYLGSIKGDLALAVCLCKANVSSVVDYAARGTIFTYGVDGVCHQLSNQILWASHSKPTGSLTVAGARGYLISTFLFGTYGLQHAAWLMKQKGCGTVVGGGPTIPMGPDMEMQVPDEFERHAREILVTDAQSEQLRALLQLRQSVLTDNMRLSTEGAFTSAKGLNARYNQFLREAATLLDPADFKQVFGISPNETIDIVDEKVFEAANSLGAKKS
jgi:hypothetical protein